MAEPSTLAPAPSGSTPRDAQARVGNLIGQHGNALLRVARKVSLCADDAHDAFQRALEIYLRRLDTLDPATEAAWMRVVVRNEALAVRRNRSQHVQSDEPDLDAHVDHDQRSLEERVESSERVTRSAEALRQLKPDEARALLLKAEGLSYGEIGEQLGWTYTKVNRCITEGRARFRKVFQGIESGAQCERFAPLLAALAAGDADADTLVRLKPHLRHCLGCRADVRRLHGARWPNAAAWLPLPGVLDRLRPGSIKAELYGLFGRLHGADPVATSLAGGGGGRGAGATALVGLCLAGASAGGYCALGGPLPEVPIAGAARGSETQKVSATPTPTPAAPTPVATVAAEPVQPSAPEAPTHEREPEPPAPAATPHAGSDEFSFEAATAESPPASTPPPAPERTEQPVTTSAPADPAPAETVPTEPPGGEFGFER